MRLPRHPAQLYDGLVALILFVVLSRAPRGLPAGSRLAAFLVLYGSARLLLGGVRLDPPFLFGLQIEQILALGAIRARFAGHERDCRVDGFAGLLTACRR